jgi:hypothetical protein
MIAPEKIPTTPDAFKSWIDAACVSWSPELMTRAYHAWEAMAGKPHRTVVDIDTFKASYAERLRVEHRNKSAA